MNGRGMTSSGSSELARARHGRPVKLTQGAVVATLSEAGCKGLSFNELFGRLGRGSKSTLWDILKVLASEGVAERDIETRKYVLSRLSRRARTIPVPLMLSRPIVDLVDLAVSKRLAASRSELAETALVGHLYLLSQEGKLGINKRSLEKTLGAKLDLTGHLTKLLMKVDKRLGRLEKQAGLQAS